ncbi:MAG: hypothetical protein NTX50_15255 [Candidatus Sumerlaeota bacterium]|nr:hypothetical protein [Candidatus Sumerlaeota bacterium]
MVAKRNPEKSMESYIRIASAKFSGEKAAFSLRISSMSSVIYVETSIPSFYFDVRASAEMQAKRKWTREWWDSPKYDAELVIGLPVLFELQRIPTEKRDKALALIQDLPVQTLSECK